MNLANTPTEPDAKGVAKADLTDLLDAVCDEWMHTTDHLDLYDDRYSIAAKVLGEVPDGWAKERGRWVQTGDIYEAGVSFGMKVAKKAHELSGRCTCPDGGAHGHTTFCPVLTGGR